MSVLTNGSFANAAGLPCRWTVQCEDDKGQPIEVNVIAVVDGHVAVQMPGCKPIWLDRFQGDRLASCLLKAVTAALLTRSASANLSQYSPSVPQEEGE